MRKSGFYLTCFCVLSCFGCGHYDAGPSAPSVTLLRAPVKLRIDFTSSGLPLVQARVNGCGPYSCVLDTGTNCLVLARKVLREVNPRVKGTTVIMSTPAGPKRLGSMYHVDTVKLGEAEFHGLEACSADLSNLRSATEPEIDAVLGLRVFAHCQLTIDYAAGEVLLERAKTTRLEDDRESKFILPLKLSGLRTVYVPLTIDGTTAWAMIDSGYSAGFTFPDSMAQELDFVDRPVRLPSSTATFHGSVANYAARLKGSVLLGRNKFVNPIIRIQGNKPLIGSGVLKHFVVTINQRKKVAFFARRKHGPIGPPPSIRHHGFYFRPQQNCWLVKSAIAGTTLDKLGLRVDDQVTAVNVRATSELSKQDLQGLVDTNDRLVLRIIRDGQELTIEVPVTILIP